MAVFGSVRHQIREFHIIAELTKAVLKAVTKIRRVLKAERPKLSRGRPQTKEQKRNARHQKRLQKKITDLFEHRYLFVKHYSTQVEKRTFTRITRGRPQLRTLRDIRDEV